MVRNRGYGWESGQLGYWIGDREEPEPNAYATASLAFGALSLVALWCLYSPSLYELVSTGWAAGAMVAFQVLAVVSGVSALHQIRRSAGKQRGRSEAVAGIVLGSLGLGYDVFILGVIYYVGSG